MGDDWDPFSVDGAEEPAPAPGPSAEPSGEGQGEEKDLVIRIKKEDMSEVVDEVCGRFAAEKPWQRVPDLSPDLLWSTPTCPLDNWKHHDVKVELGNGIAYVINNRPNENNSMQDTLSHGMEDAVMGLHARKDIRVAVFTGEGRMYSAGGDPKAWQAQAAFARGEHIEGDGTAGVRIPRAPAKEEVQWHLHYLGQRATAAGAFPDGKPDIGRLCAAKLMNTITQLPQFTISLVNGSAMGGGVGWVCSMDYVIAVKRAYIVLSEVKIGVIPATISPYVVQKMGTSNAKRLFCCAENLSAERAKEYGIVNEVVENMREGHARVREIVALISRCGPRAVEAAKQLVMGVSGAPLTEALMHYTCQVRDSVAGSEEAKEAERTGAAGQPPPWQSAPIGFDVWPTVGVQRRKGEGKGEE